MPAFMIQCLLVGLVGGVIWVVLYDLSRCAMPTVQRVFLLLLAAADTLMTIYLLAENAL